MQFKFENYKTAVSSNSLIIFTKDSPTKKELSNYCNNIIPGDIDNYIKNAKFKGDLNQVLTIPTGNEKLSQIVFFGLGKIENLKERQLKEIGAKLFDISNNKMTQIISLVFACNLSAIQKVLILFGIKLRSYYFNKYITKKKDETKCNIETIKLLSKDFSAAKELFKKYEILADSIAFAKDLTNEPPNHLYPESFAKRCKELEKLGIVVEILTPAEMKKLGMGAILGVGQGSSKAPRVVVMKWNGGKKNDKPLAFAGKGVTFDTGGISLKSAAGMFGMKYDMTGAAVITGLIRNLAIRKAKLNVVCIAGLVENMPDGNAQRPEDIVTSMSGQTIEVLNTDAEGRLLLADILWYAQDKFNPSLIIDVATLTGAMIVALGEQYAGLFSNNDKIVEQLIKAGEQTGEKLWRLPLAPEYDKLIDSKIADMQNISTNAAAGAGSIVAAQFLQRFINNKIWAHLDIAGVDHIKNSALHQQGPTLFGIDLLNKFIEDNYESK